jgi:hypothetical protein
MGQWMNSRRLVDGASDSIDLSYVVTLAGAGTSHDGAGQVNIHDILNDGSDILDSLARSGFGVANTSRLVEL